MGLLDTIYSAGRTGAGLIDSALGKIGNVQDLGLLAESLQHAARPKRLYEGTGTLARLSEARGTYRDSLLQRRKLEEDIEYKKSLTAYNQASAEHRAAEIQSRQQTQMGMNQHQDTLINTIQASPYLTNADRLTINALGGVATPQSIQGLGRMLSKYQTAAALPEEKRAQYLNLGGSLGEKFAEQALFPSGSTNKGEIKEVNGQLWRIKDGVATPVTTQDGQPLIEAPEPEESQQLSGYDLERLKNENLKSNVDQTNTVQEWRKAGKQQKKQDNAARKSWRDVRRHATDLRGSIARIMERESVLPDWLKGRLAVGLAAARPLVKAIPWLSDNLNLIEDQLVALQANTAFDKLREMREGTPHGGALGNVSNMELRALQQAFMAISTDMSPKDFLRQVDKAISALDRNAKHLFEDEDMTIPRQVIYDGDYVPIDATGDNVKIYPGGRIIYKDQLRGQSELAKNARKDLFRMLYEEIDYIGRNKELENTYRIGNRSIPME
jgi:hypothetical protein